MTVKYKILQYQNAKILYVQKYILILAIAEISR